MGRWGCVLVKGVGSGKLKRGQKFGAGGRFSSTRVGMGAGNFPIYFFQSLSFLHLEITYFTLCKLCYAFENKNFFSTTIVS